jgi:AcrR family transcriptional regulator
MRITADAREATKRRILDVSAELFSSQGWDSATTRDIAAAAGIATGTLFNYFPTKEAIATCLASEALERATEEFQAKRRNNSGMDAPLEEELFLLVWTGLRHLLPYRNFIVQALSGVLSPLADFQDGGEAIRTRHIDLAAQLMAEHGPAPSRVALRLYWSLYLGVLAHWAADNSPHQEDTVALLDQSLILFTGVLQNLSPTTQPCDEDSGAEVDSDSEAG